MIKIGFTGTQTGMTQHQKDMVELILTFHKYSGGISEVHHGDCVGADDEFNTIAGDKYLLKSIAHPSDIDSKRAWGRYEVCLPTKTPLERNHNIVDAVDIMIATPKERLEVLRSGTWATIRYCRKIGKIVHIIYP